ncbi:MAG: hypothetical protein K1X86_09200 [Ignavibacteria bacterium]|nr:hypothetical protein [Ignavibacteria bacterium]
MPPESFYLKPLPANIVTVPACDKCNRDYQKDEEYFKLMVVSKDGTGANPKFEVLVDDLVIKLQEKKPFHINFVKNSMLVEFVDTEGNIIETKRGTKPDEDRMNNFIKKMLLGLHYKHSERLLLECELTPVIFWEEFFEDYSDECKEVMVRMRFDLSNSINHNVGNGILNYSYIIKSKNDAIQSVWRLTFYENVSFLAFLCIKNRI